MWEVAFEDRDRESKAQKIWGGSRTLSSKAMVDDRVEGEVDPLYLHWFFDQTPLKIMPEGSAREIIDRGEEIEVRIKQARLEVERNYRSTLDILNNDLKNVKEELARRDAIFEERVALIEKRVEKKHLSTIRTLHDDLGIVTGAMEQQEEEYKNEKRFLIHAQARLQTQLKTSMGRERDIANRFTFYQAEVATERNQWMEEREEFRNQIEEHQAHEVHLSDEVVTTEE